MGRPDHPTIEVPAETGLEDLVTGAIFDPQQIRGEFRDAVSGGGGRAGHLCVISWALSEDLTQALLVHHRRFGWMPPGGHLATGETVYEGAARELAEETGVQPGEPGEVVSVHGTLIPAHGESPAHMHWAFGVAHLLDPSAERPCGEDGQEARWQTLADGIEESWFGDNWMLGEIASHLRREQRSR